MREVDGRPQHPRPWLGWACARRLPPHAHPPRPSPNKGDTVKATLNFEHAGPVDVEFKVLGVGAAGTGGMKGGTDGRDEDVTGASRRADRRSRVTALALCRFAHFLAAMLTFGASAYLGLYAPERLMRALSPAVRRLALVASLVALATAIVWLVLEFGRDGRRLERRRRSASDRRRPLRDRVRPCVGRASRSGGRARRRRRLRPRRPMGADRRRIGGAAGEPRPCRPRRDADRRRRRPAPRQPRRPPSRGGGLDRRPRSFRRCASAPTSEATPGGRLSWR